MMLLGPTESLVIADEHGRPGAPRRRPADRGRARHRLLVVVLVATSAAGRGDRAELAGQLADLPPRGRGGPAARSDSTAAACSSAISTRPSPSPTATRPSTSRSPVPTPTSTRSSTAGTRRRDPRRPAHAVQRGQLRHRLPGVAADDRVRRGVVGHHGRGVPQAHGGRPGRRARPGAAWRRRSIALADHEGFPAHAAAIRRRSGDAAAFELEAG